MKRKLIFVVGPTASGKTAAAIDLALRCGGEVVSADSVAIYRGMDVGSAKPSAQEMRGVPHHMLSCADPAVPYSVSEYKQDALRCIEAIFARGRQPIVCGGTGLYVNALLFPLDFTASPANEAVRRKWQAFCEENGAHALHEALRRVDPVSAGEIHENNVRRVIRALEIYECTGTPKSAQRSLDRKEDLPYDPVLAGVTWPRETLYARCDARVDAMLRSGLVEEVRALRAGGLADGAQSCRPSATRRSPPTFGAKPPWRRRGSRCSAIRGTWPSASSPGSAQTTKSAGLTSPPTRTRRRFLGSLPNIP